MNWSGFGSFVFALKNMCSYMWASPAYSGLCVNEPFFTSISTVAKGTPWFSSTITSRPFDSTLRFTIFSRSARCACAAVSGNAAITASAAMNLERLERDTIR